VCRAPTSDWLISSLGSLGNACQERAESRFGGRPKAGERSANSTYQEEGDRGHPARRITY
jgi:hypothetical protein